MLVSDFERKRLEKAEEHVGRNVVSLTMKMKSIVRIFYVISIKTILKKKLIFS